MKSLIATIAILLVSTTGSAQPPAPPNIVESPALKVLTGLTVSQFETEMQLMTQALGLSCGSCHARGNFASDANPRKVKARTMLEMTRMINQQYFPDHKPAEGESRLGRVTCFTCHAGEAIPKAPPKL